MATSGMLGTIVQVALVLCGVALLYWLIQYLGLPTMVQKIATVILVLLVVIWLLSTVFPGVL